MKRITSFLFVISLTLNAFCQSQQRPNKPDTCFDNPLRGYTAWVNPLNAEDSNNIYTSDTLNTLYSRSQYLEATGFNFTIPVGSKIVGITVQVRGHQSGNAILLTLEYGCLVKNSVIQNDSIRGLGLSATDSWETFAGCSNMWNDTTWNYVDINSPTFGAAYFATASFINNSGYYRMYIDAIRVTVCYNMPNSAKTLSQTSTIGEVYPNPTKGILTLKYTGKYIVQLYDLMGKEVYSVSLNGQQQVDVSALCDGMYIMHITQGNNTSIQRVVLKR